MKTLALFTAWILGSVLTAVIPAVLVSLFTPATYDGVVSNPYYCAVTFLLGTCFIGVYTAQEVDQYLNK
jgi:uncharacterized membrane protein